MNKFSRTLGGQSISTPDSALLTFPNGDWLLAFLVRFDGIVTGDVTQYLFSSGNFAAAGSLNIVFYGAGVAGATLQGRIAVYANTLSNANAPALLSAAQFSGGEHMVFLERAGGTVTLSTCPILKNRPLDDSALILQATTSGGTSGAIGAIVRELNGSGFMWGSRVDNDATRKCDQSMSRLLRANQSITGLEKCRLAFGEEFSDLGYKPVTYVRASSPTDVADRSENVLSYTVAGSPTESAEPKFGYVPGQTPQPDPEAITVSNAVPLQLIGSDGSDALVTFSGALSGAQASSIEIQLTDADGVEGPWVALQSSTIIAGSYSGARRVPDGGPFRYKARKKAGSTILASSSISTSKILVGHGWINAGSSSSDYLFTSKSGTGYTPAIDTAVMSGTSPTWSPMSSTGAATRMADELSAYAGKPIGWLDYGVEGTTLRTWLDANSTHRKNLSQAIAAFQGKIFGLYVTVGANDAANGWITSSAQHEADMQKFIQDMRAETVNPNLKVVWVGSPSRLALNSVQADRLRQAESKIGNYEGVVHVQALQFASASDNVHLAPSLDGYAACGTMAMYQAGRAFYGGEDPKMVRGPALASMTYSGSKIRCAISMRDGTDWTPSSPGGFVVQNKQSDNTYVTLSGIAVQRVNAGMLEIECGVALSDPIVKYLGGSAPNVANAIYSNGALPLPMTVEVEMPVLLDSSVPQPIVQSVDVTPAAATVQGGASQQFSATVSGQNNPSQAVTWARSPAVGSLSASGFFTAPAATSSAQTIIITANSQADSAFFDTATVTVPAATQSSTVTGVTVTPANLTLGGGQSASLNAIVSGTGSPSQAVNWSRSPALGSLNSSGQFTAPAATGEAQTITVRATSQQDPTKSGTATVTVPAVTQAFAYTPSESRTLIAQTSSTVPFTAKVPGYWNTSANPKVPYGLKDPSDVIDIPLQWGEVLADMGATGIAKASIVVPSGLSKVAEDVRDGSLQVGFFSGGQPGRYTVTYHIVTDSIPPREFDRSFQFLIEER